MTVTSLIWDFYFFKLSQPLTVSTVQLLYTVKEKGGKPDRKPYPLPYGLKNPYRNLKPENSQDYAQKPQQNWTFMNSASLHTPELKPCICTYRINTVLASLGIWLCCFHKIVLPCESQNTNYRDTAHNKRPQTPPPPPHPATTTIKTKGMKFFVYRMLGSVVGHWG